MNRAKEIYQESLNPQTTDKAAQWVQEAITHEDEPLEHNHRGRDAKLYKKDDVRVFLSEQAAEEIG